MNKYKPWLLIFCVLLIFCRTDFWQIKWMACFISLGLFLEGPIGWLLAYMVGSAAVVLHMPYLTLPVGTREACAYGLLKVGAFAFVYYFVARKYDLWKPLAYANVVLSLATIVTKCVGLDGAGLFGNYSMNSIAIAFTLPFAWRHVDKRYFVPLNILAIALYPNTIGSVAYLSGLLVLAGVSLRNLSMVSVLGAFSLWINWHKASSFNGRLPAYKLFMSEWLNIGSLSFGTGTGTFSSWSQVIQVTKNFMIQPIPGSNSVKVMSWHYLHSDILEFMFTNGIIGMLLLSYVTYYFIKKGRHDKKSLAFFLIFFISCCLSYPCSHAFHVICLGTMLAAIETNYTFGVFDTVKRRGMIYV